MRSKKYKHGLIKAQDTLKNRPIIYSDKCKATGLVIAKVFKNDLNIFVFNILNSIIINNFKILIIKYYFYFYIF